MDVNKADVYLLKNKPGDLIVKYQSLIVCIVYNFYKSGFVNSSDIEDYVQYVNTELLQKTDYIKKKYNGSSPLKIYLTVIIRNLCYEKLRKGRKYENEIKGKVVENEESENITANIIIEQEIDYLDKILKTFHKKREKLVLCLKLLFRIKVRPDDFKINDYKFDESDIQEIIEKTGQSKSLSDKDVYEYITPMLNKYEGKENTSDTTRKWVSNKLNEIIDLMNGDPPRAKYTRETIQILIEKYFEKT